MLVANDAHHWRGASDHQYETESSSPRPVYVLVSRLELDGLRVAVAMAITKFAYATPPRNVGGIDENLRLDDVPVSRLRVQASVEAGLKLGNHVAKYWGVQSRGVYRRAEHVDHDALNTVLGRLSAQV
jgi:hypothetical protein